MRRAVDLDDHAALEVFGGNHVALTSLNICLSVDGVPSKPIFAFDLTGRDV
jgi:hypothetical protein